MAEEPERSGVRREPIMLGPIDPDPKLDGRLRPAMMLDPSPRLLVELSPIVAELVRAVWACKLQRGCRWLYVHKM